MKRIVLTFGLISGAILSAMMLAAMPLIHKIGPDRWIIIGYTTMVLAFLLVFFGIRSYRENIGQGQISFGRALSVGLLIMVIASVCYVITWEFIYHTFLPDFVEKYSTRMIEQVRASGKSQEEITRELERMKYFKNLYNNNILFSAGISFLEPLSIGVPMTLISALILRKRKRDARHLTS